ncbi:ATP-binding protein [Spirillospora sp. NPDC048832]|nr:ATP-binding protein [Actinomadura meyerae]
MAFGGQAGRRLAAQESGETHGTASGRASAGEGALRLPAEVESVPEGRRWLRDVLEQQFGKGHPKVDDALQSLSEILTNAVLYGTGLHVRVTCKLDGGWAEVAVHNDGRPGGSRPQKQDAAPDAEGGRGLDLVSLFSDQWGITMLPKDDVKVWFRVRFT